MLYRIKNSSVYWYNDRMQLQRIDRITAKILDKLDNHTEITL